MLCNFLTYVLRIVYTNFCINWHYSNQDDALFLKINTLMVAEAINSKLLCNFKCIRINSSTMQILSTLIELMNFKIFFKDFTFNSFYKNL